MLTEVSEPKGKPKVVGVRLHRTCWILGLKTFCIIKKKLWPKPDHLICTCFITTTSSPINQIRSRAPLPGPCNWPYIGSLQPGLRAASWFSVSYKHQTSWKQPSHPVCQRAAFTALRASTTASFTSGCRLTHPSLRESVCEKDGKNDTYTHTPLIWCLCGTKQQLINKNFEAFKI